MIITIIQQQQKYKYKLPHQDISIKHFKYFKLNLIPSVYIYLYIKILVHRSC